MPSTPEPRPPAAPATPAAAPDEQVVDPTPHAPGRTTPATSDGPAPRLPNERDESADSQAAAAPQPMIEQALRDVERGLVDTGRAPVTDELYHRMAHNDDVPASPASPVSPASPASPASPKPEPPERRG